MIRFSCRCGRALELDDDQAGLDVQCPACGTLNSVPSLSDALGIDPDGTYKVDADEGEREHARLSELRRVFTRNRVDEETGDEIDLRATYADLADAGIPDEPQPEAAPTYVRPKYDPVTGELIRPIDVKRDDRHRPIHPSAIPVARAQITYASAGTARAPGDARTAVSAPLDLLRPANLMVMGVLLLLHGFSQVVVAVCLVFGLLFVSPVLLFFFFGLIAHYANVVDEVGPRDMDELPRPFRDLEFGEDIWRPFVQMFVSVAVTYGLAVLVPSIGTGHPLLVLAGLVLATALFPAVMLTATTSGTFANLRPDRVASVVLAAPGRYVVLAALWAVASAAYVFGVYASNMTLLTTFSLSTTWPWWYQWYVGYPLLVIGLYLVHLFAWELGLLYRAHHADFNWVLQRHKRKEQAKGFEVMRRGPAGHELPVLEGLPTTEARPAPPLPPLARRSPRQ